MNEMIAQAGLLYVAIGMLAVLVVVLAAVLIRIRRASRPYRISAFAPLITHLDDPCAILSDGKIVAVNRAFESLIQPAGATDFVGVDVLEAFSRQGANLPNRAHLRKLLAKDGSVRFDHPFALQGDRYGFVEASIALIDGGGETDYVLFLRNVTTRIENEQRLRQRDLQYQKAMQIVGLASWVYDVKAGRQEWSEEMRTLFGVDQVDQKTSLYALPAFERIHPEDQYVGDIISKHVASGEDPPPMTFRIVRPDGDIRHLEAHVGRLVDDLGELTHIVTMVKDITQEIDREHQLRHAQKMEAVGQLTGGLAHDFNNLLHVILGNAELISTPVDMTDRSCLEAISRAASRGSELTQRLLAFSRKQMLEFKSIEVNECIRQMVPLFQRTLGAQVIIETDLPNDPLYCRTDVSQLENCLLNLALNAQHAMPTGGKLTIRTANVVLDSEFARNNVDVTPGRYTEISVIDTGVGMSEPILERVFEPFFTTKEAGKGSGLGLSMVFGFMKQCNGHAMIESEVGHGTTVKLLLPIARSIGDADEAQANLMDSQFEGKVLLVEDDEQVSELTARFLQSMGFEVVHADNAVSAHREIQANRFDLLVSDVMLPGGVDGPAIGENFLRRFPESKVMYMSGYSEVAISKYSALNEGAVLLNKPFRRSDLLESVKLVLGV